MRISIDSDRCTGHAKCWSVLPEVYELDDEGYALVRIEQVPADLEDRARATVNNCPERAIKLKA